ncbi:MAG: hypothetical protein ACR2P4_07760 [Gammaproteobacteria bacterium]
MNRTPFQGYDIKEIPAYAGMTGFCWIPAFAGMTRGAGMTKGGNDEGGG